MNTGAGCPRLRTALALPALACCLFGDCTVVKNSCVLGSVVNEAGAIVSDPGAQWIVFICASIYYLAFAVLRGHQRGGAGAGKGGGLRIENSASIVQRCWAWQGNGWRSLPVGWPG